jgi:uncharacterized membrane protein
MRPFWILVIVIVAASLFASWALLPVLPERMAVHWGLSGEPNGWMDRLPAVLFLPALMLVLALFLDWLPSLDPRGNILKFNLVYEQFLLALLFLLAIMHLDLLAWGVGLLIPPQLVLVVGFALLLFSISRLLAASLPNYFIGIRTPWALEDDSNWHATHRLAASLYHWSVPVCLLGLLIPAWSIWLLLLAAVVPSLLAVVYSYLAYAQKRKKQIGGRRKRKAKKKARKK